MWQVYLPVHTISCVPIVKLHHILYRLHIVVFHPKYKISVMHKFDIQILGYSSRIVPFSGDAPIECKEITHCRRTAHRLYAGQRKKTHGAHPAQSNESRCSLLQAMVQTMKIFTAP